MGARVGYSFERMKVADDPILKVLYDAPVCSRCGGFMVTEPCYDFRVLRCVQCGDLVDPVILQNRQHRSAPTQRTNRQGQHSRAA